MIRGTTRILRSCGEDMDCVLTSDAVTVQVCPHEGGRVSSLRCNTSGTEFLTQARPVRAAVVPRLEAQFVEGPCAGIEDCLPTVAASGAETEGGPAPDHGDFWQLPWRVLAQTSSMVQMEAVGFSRPLQLSKQVRVEGRSLRMSYRVTNQGAEPVSLLYAAHPLLAISVGDRVVLPEEVRTLKVIHARGPMPLAEGTTVAWPRPHGSSEAVDLSVTGAAEAGAAAMLYSGRLQRGACGLYRTHAGQGIAVRFSPDQLPYLGVWLCYGGWPEEGGQPKQYAVALEPTFAPHGRLDQAQQAGLARRLVAGASASWQIEFALTRPGQDLESFRREVYAT